MRSFKPKAIVLIAALIAVVGAIVAYAKLSPPVPDDVAANQLGPLAVEILSHPARAEAYAICNSHEPCFAAASHDPHVLMIAGYPAIGPARPVPQSVTRPLVAYLFNGANHEGASTAHFFPQFAIRYNGAGDAYTDVVISLPDHAMRVTSNAAHAGDSTPAWLTNVSSSVTDPIAKALFSQSAK